MQKSIYLSIALMLVLTISKAQSIPNSGFENWTSMGSYSNPDSWGCLNSMTNAFSVYCCEKGTPGAVGTSFLKLTSKNLATNVCPGIAVSGVINTTTFQPVSGFPYANRPTALTGKWQHMIYGTSQGFVDVKLTRWDATAQNRILVASAHQVLVGMDMSWTSFSIPLTYSDANMPDSCIIVLAASGSVPTNNDYLWVDNLAFIGGTGITENNSALNIRLFPNPSSSSLMIDLSNFNNEKVSLQVIDMNGKAVKTSSDIIASSATILDIADLAKGNYLLSVISKEGTVSRKFIRQ